MNSLPTLKHEIELWEKGHIVIGVDEVGRGAFAGPLCVGGVIFSPTTNHEQTNYLLSLEINDSKKLSASRRKMLSRVIQKESIAYYVSTISVSKINRFGIARATFMGMRNVVKNLRETLELGELGVQPLKGLNPRESPPTAREGSPERFFVLVDGFYVKYLKGVGLKNQKGIVHGDEISLSIAAASIIAKVARDNQMRKLSAKYKEYGWGRNKGYGTKFHRSAIAEFGPTPLHRTDFIDNYVTIY